jgi:hypothetical protein
MDFPCPLGKAPSNTLKSPYNRLIEADAQGVPPLRGSCSLGAAHLYYKGFPTCQANSGHERRRRSMSLPCGALLR